VNARLEQYNLSSQQKAVLDHGPGPTSLIKRFQTPEEVAAVVCVVASSQANFDQRIRPGRAEGGVIAAIFRRTQSGALIGGARQLLDEC